MAWFEEFALRTFVNLSPSPQWANQQIEPYLGLPFGTYLRAARPYRQRTLTGPLDPDPSQQTLWHRTRVLLALQSEQRTDDQTACAFFSMLPYDIRVIIYEMVLGAMVFHVSAPNPKSRLVHYVCNRPDVIEDEGANHACSNDMVGRPASALPENVGKARGVLSLLMCCRKTYSEAINLLYATNTFVFTQNFAAFTFLKCMLPAQRLCCLRRFRLHMRIPRHPDLNHRANRDWTDLWKFFGAEMTGLQSLYLELQMLQPTEAHIESTPDDEAESWIAPMAVMAVEAYRRRGCRVEIETRRVKHAPAQIFMQISRESPGVGEEDVFRLTCAALHKRIRLSLG
jgi:hypothetical protein